MYATPVKKKLQLQRPCFADAKLMLSQLKGFTVCALNDGGILFVGSDIDFIQRTVLVVHAVVFALLNGTADGLIGLGTIHFIINLLYHGFEFIMCENEGNYEMRKFLLNNI